MLKKLYTCSYVGDFDIIMIYQTITVSVCSSLFFVLCSLFFVLCSLLFVLCSLFFVLLCSLFFVLLLSNKAETAVHGCHYLGDMAVRMCKVLARPWVGV